MINTKKLYSDLSEAIGNPNKVWCRKCGRSQNVNASTCFKYGWPMCCNETMTIDQPKKSKHDLD